MSVTTLTDRGKRAQDSTTIPRHGSVDRQNIVTPEKLCPDPCSPEFQCWHGQEWSGKTTKYCDPSAPTLLGLNIEIWGNGGEAKWPLASRGHNISSIYRTHLVGQWSLSKAAHGNAIYFPQTWTSVHVHSAPAASTPHAQAAAAERLRALRPPTPSAIGRAGRAFPRRHRG